MISVPILIKLNNLDDEDFESEDGKVEDEQLDNSCIKEFIPKNFAQNQFNDLFQDLVILKMFVFYLHS